MKNLTSELFRRPAVLKIALLAATLMFAAVTSSAQPGSRGYAPHGGARAYAGGGARVYGGGGARMYAGGGARMYAGGVRVGAGAYHGYPSGYGHPVYGGGARYYGGAHGYYVGGPHYYHGWYGYRPYGYYPYSFISLGFGWGMPYYYYPPAVYVAPQVAVAPAPAPAATQVVTDPTTPFDVTNEPPVGSYYYDPFCQQQFSTLDDYTDHLDTQNHPKTIDIMTKDSGEKLRSLEFVGGYWRVMK